MAMMMTKTTGKGQEKEESPSDEPSKRERRVSERRRWTVRRERATTTRVERNDERKQKDRFLSLSPRLCMLYKYLPLCISLTHSCLPLGSLSPLQFYYHPSLAIITKVIVLIIRNYTFHHFHIILHRHAISCLSALFLPLCA